MLNNKCYYVSSSTSDIFLTCFSQFLNCVVCIFRKHIYIIFIANIKRIAVIMSKGTQVLRERHMGAKGLKSIAITINT